MAADGSAKAEELALRTEWWIDQPSVAPDGRRALVTVQDACGFDLYALSLDARHALEPFLVTPADEQGPVLSPSGRFVAYASNESGRYEVYMRTFPSPDRKWTVSTRGGVGPVWRRDERELFYQAKDRMMVVSLSPGGKVGIGSPQVLFESSALDWSRVSSKGSPQYDVTADGQRFLMIVPEAREEAPLQIVVIPDFVAEMKARLAARKTQP